MFDLPKKKTKRFGLILLAAAFVAAGVNHFVNPAFYIQIMPPYLPAHRELVFVSGAFEIAGGLAILVHRIRVLAGWGLVALLMAVFPANIHMAVHSEQFPDIPRGALYIRLPLQVLLAFWVIGVTRRHPTASEKINSPV